MGLLVYLITGASGQVGGRVATQLVGTGAGVRALTRNPAKAVALPADVERVVGDLDDEASLITAMDGVDRLFLMHHGLGTDQTRNALRAAHATGVSYIVNLSSMSTVLEPLPRAGKDFLDREKLIEDSGITAVFLRPGLFTSNTLPWANSIRENGFVEQAGDDGAFAPIDPQDIGDVAATVARDTGHAGQRYVLTGGELMTAADQVKVLSEVLGRQLDYRVLPDEVALARIRQSGQPEPMVTVFAELFELMRSGATAVRTSTVQDLTGHQPRTYRQWAQANVRAFQ